MFFSSKKDLLGIDIGTHSIKVVALREAKGIYHLESLGLAPLPSEAIVDNSIMDAVSISSVLDNLLQSLKLKQKEVATAVAGHSVIIRKVQLPTMADDELEAQLQFEAEQYIPFDIDDVFIDFQILGVDPKDPAQMNVVLVAAKKEFIQDFQLLFEDCGLSLSVVDIACFSVGNAVEVNYGVVEDEVAGLVNVGAASVNVNIVKGGESLFTRDIQAGGGFINEELQKRLGLSSDQAEQVKLGQSLEDVDDEEVALTIEEATLSLAQDIQRSLDFFTATAGDDQIQKVYLSGGGARSSELVTLLAGRLDIPVTVVDPFAGLVVDDKNFDLEYLKSVGPIFTAAVGLATRRAGDK